MTLDGTCPGCGAYSFMPVGKCEICGADFNSSKKTSVIPNKACPEFDSGSRNPVKNKASAHNVILASEPESSQNKASAKRTKISFKEFELLKLRLNRMKEKWLLKLIEKPRPAKELSKLEKEISDIEQILADNARLIFLFH